MVLGKEGEDMRGGCKHMKVLLRPCHSWSVFAVHQEWLCPGPDCQSWGILEERQATAVAPRAWLSFIELDKAVVLV